MFTGIITDVGTVTKLEQEGDLRARILRPTLASIGPKGDG